MRARKSTLSVALASLMLLSSATVYALGLGEIDVQSGLNQPLNAEIKLLSVNQTELDALKVSLADANAYNLAGLDRPALLGQIEFNVLEKNGHYLIHLSTKQPVKEPFLDFIIEVNWPSGRLLREYTLLLDPPVFAEQAPAIDVKPATTAKTDPFAGAQEAATPETATTSAAPIQPRVSPDKNSTAAVKNGRKDSSKASSADKYGPTDKNDRLWNLAEKLRPDASISVEQMMIALFQTNPEAFYDENVNNLKAGYVLRVPDRETILKLDQATASREARMQYQRWVEQRKSTTVEDTTTEESALAMRNDASESNKVKSKSKSSSGQLKLIAPEGEGAAGAGADDKTLPKDVEGLRRELQLTMEASAASEQEKGELKARIGALEEQLASMQRLIVLKDDALVDLQSKLGPNAAASDASKSEPTNTPQVAVDVGGTKSELESKSNQQQLTRPQQSSEQDLVSWLLSNPFLLGIVLIISGLLAALVWVIIRRRRQNSDEDFQEFLAQDSMVENLDDHAKAITKPTKNRARITPVITNNNDASVAQPEESSIDPLAEADVYLAYRRYQQAEDLIRDAISKEPRREDLQLKLLEIYFAMGNKSSFEAQAESLYVLWSGNSNPKWAKVAQMGRELSPDHPLFNDNNNDGEIDEFHLDNEHEVESLFSNFEEPSEVETKAKSYSETPTASTQLNNRNTGTSEFSATDLEGFTENIIEFETGLSDSKNKPRETGSSQFTSQFKADDGNALDFNFGDDLESENPKGSDKFIPEHLDKALESAADSELFDSVNPSYLGGTSSSLAVANNNSISEQKSKSANNGSLDLSSTEAESIDIEFSFDDVLLDHDEQDLFAMGDVASTKLDLARAYIDMDDNDSARSILGEVLNEGNEIQKEEARQLMRQIG